MATWTLRAKVKWALLPTRVVLTPCALMRLRLLGNVDRWCDISGHGHNSSYNSCQSVNSTALCDT